MERKAVAVGGGRMLKWGLLVGVAAVGLVLDQITKRLAEARMPLGRVYELLPFLSLQRTQNTGVSFGMLQGRTWLIALATVVAVVIIVTFVHMEKRPVTAGVVGGLVLAGALGNNVIDRLRQGYVTDFIKFPYWPNFNVADILLVVGVALLILLLVRGFMAAEKSAAEEVVAEEAAGKVEKAGKAGSLEEGRPWESGERR